MKLIIDLSQEKPCLVLKNKRRKEISHRWDGLSLLSETIFGEIDKMLKKNGLVLADIEKVEVIPSKKSLVSTRIAKAVALGLKMKLSQ